VSPFGTRTRVRDAPLEQPKGHRSRKLKDALHRKALFVIEKPDSTAICSLETQTDSK